MAQANTAPGASSLPLGLVGSTRMLHPSNEGVPPKLFAPNCSEAESLPDV